MTCSQRALCSKLCTGEVKLIFSSMLYYRIVSKCILYSFTPPSRGKICTFYPTAFIWQLVSLFHFTDKYFRINLDGQNIRCTVTACRFQLASARSNSHKNSVCCHKTSFGGVITTKKTPQRLHLNVGWNTQWTDGVQADSRGVETPVRGE